VKVKICGITNITDALFCESKGADYLGFVFYNNSKRYVLPEEAKSIINQLSPTTKKVGVFVNETSGIINKLADELQLDFVQLHGEETPESISSIKFPVIKAFRVNESFDFSIIGKYKDQIVPLFDTFSNESYGGTGKTFNWDMIPAKIRDKIFLSGGISAGNLPYIYKNIHPFAVDVSSSLEILPGKKDRQKIKEFFLSVNALNREKVL
jgi:phosphoribosylanthranilate isomerase